MKSFSLFCLAFSCITDPPPRLYPYHTASSLFTDADLTVLDFVGIIEVLILRYSKNTVEVLDTGMAFALHPKSSESVDSPYDEATGNECYARHGKARPEE